MTTVALTFLRNFGISGTSGVLSALSAGVGSLAGDSEVDKERQKARSEREISGIGAGLVEGGSSIASGFKRGFTGFVNKPLQGASQAGVTGKSRLCTMFFVGLCWQASRPIRGKTLISASAEDQ